MAAHFSQVVNQAKYGFRLSVTNDQSTNLETDQALQDMVNLPKVADLFWSHADEEREHAKAFINYLRMRYKILKLTTRHIPVTFQGSDKQ